MFTGIVTHVGKVTAARTRGGLLALEVAEPAIARELHEGDSVAVNGVCLTAREHGAGWFTAAATSATLARTTIAHWSAGRRVNLERSLRLGDPLGGHIVQGHVDGVGEVRAVRQAGDARLVDVALPPAVAELAVPRGSVAIDGVSLTISELPDPETVRVALIDYTLRHTTLGELAAGDGVHVEGDIIGKYVQRLVGAYRANAAVTG